MWGSEFRFSLRNQGLVVIKYVKYIITYYYILYIT